MLDDFKENKFYNYAINLKKYYHAYIFEVDNIEKSMPLILAFAKVIVCKMHFTNRKKCLDCNICHLIDQGNYSGLIIIEPDNIGIKKEQVLDMQKKLSYKSVDNNNQVYIIKYAEKMNQSAANSLLKFIEEPLDNLYCILVTTDKRDLLETIISRCILISLKQEKEIYDKEDIKKNNDFLLKIYQEKENSLPYIKSMFLNYYSKREDIIKAFNIIEMIIDNIINNSKNKDLCDIISNELSNISKLYLINILEIVVLYKNKLLTNPNININLFMDRFIIDISEVIK